MKKTDKTPCAESWELSFHKGGLTRLENGKTLAESVTEKDLGENMKKIFLFSRTYKVYRRKAEFVRSSPPIRRIRVRIREFVWENGRSNIFNDEYAFVKTF